MDMRLWRNVLSFKVLSEGIYSVKLFNCIKKSLPRYSPSALTDLFDIFLRSCSNSSKDLNLHRLNGSLFSSVYSLTLQSRIFARDFPQSCLDISHQLALIRLVNDFMLLILNCRGLDTFFISPSFVSTSYSPLL